MPLATIDDLQHESPDVVASYVRWAGELSDIYNQFIENDDENVEYTVQWGAASARSAGLHASELSGCQRKVVYSLMNAERKERVDPFWKRKFRAGHAIHAMIQNDLRRMCEKSKGLVTFEEEIRINPRLQEIAEEYDIYSACDGVFVFYDQVGGPPVLRVGLEIKTESPDQWKALKEPRPYHKEQATVYMKCLNIPLMWTFYFNKGTQNVVKSEYPWLFTFDHHLWANLEQRMKDRHRDAANADLPDRTESIQCEFCAFAHLCKPPSLEKKAKMEEAKRSRDKSIIKNPHKRLIVAR